MRPSGLLSAVICTSWQFAARRQCAGVVGDDGEIADLESAAPAQRLGRRRRIGEVVFVDVERRIAVQDADLCPERLRRRRSMSTELKREIEGADRRSVRRMRPAIP